MDTLGCAASLVALFVQLLTSVRVWSRFVAGTTERPWTAIIVVCVLSAAGIVLGIRGYHKDWPRWANGRAVFAVVISGLLMIISLFEITVRLGSQN
ncbi:MAG: hypothetical protein ACKVS6_07895 [Planctomycetota bacterium]